MPDRRSEPPRNLMFALLVMAVVVGIATGYWVFFGLT